MRSESFAGPTPALALLLAFTFVACGDSRPDKGSPQAGVRGGEAPVQSPLVGSESVQGLQALHDTVHARAVRGDTLGLLRLFVRDSVYRALVWPTQPSYEPDRDEVWMLVGGMNKANSNKGLRRLLADLEGGGSQRPPLPAFTLKEVEGGMLHAREKSELARGELSLFAAALCLGDHCQVLTYANAGMAGKQRDPQEGEPAPKESEPDAP